MGFRTDAFATVWEVQPQNDRWAKARITISRKDPETQEYETEFSSWVDVFGTAATDKMTRLKAGTRIQLKSIDLTTFYDAEKKIFYWNPKIFDFELASEVADGSAPKSPGGGGKNVSRGTRANTGARTNPGASKPKPAVKYYGDDEELPF